MEKIIDLHVHTEFSCDSEAKMEQYIEQACNKNMQVICFTDHVDLNPNDYGFNFFANREAKATCYRAGT